MSWNAECQQQPNSYMNIEVLKHKNILQLSYLGKLFTWISEGQYYTLVLVFNEDT